MLVVGADAATVQAQLDATGSSLVVAAINGPRTTVVSGTPTALTAFSAWALSQELFSAPVPIRYASHSPQMHPLMAPLASALEALSPAEGSLPLYSTVTGGALPGRHALGGS